MGTLLIEYQVKLAEIDNLGKPDRCTRELKKIAATQIGRM